MAAGRFVCGEDRQERGSRGRVIRGETHANRRHATGRQVIRRQCDTKLIVAGRGGVAAEVGDGDFERTNQYDRVGEAVVFCGCFVVGCVDRAESGEVEFDGGSSRGGACQRNGCGIRAFDENPAGNNSGVAASCDGNESRVGGYDYCWGWRTRFACDGYRSGVVARGGRGRQDADDTIRRYRNQEGSNLGAIQSEFDRDPVDLGWIRYAGNSFGPESFTGNFKNGSGGDFSPVGDSGNGRDGCDPGGGREGRESHGSRNKKESVFRH